MNLIEKELGAVPVKASIGGKEYQLAFPMKAVILYKQRTGDNLFQKDTWDKVDPQQDPERFLACLWAAVQTHHPEVTFDELAGLVNFGNVKDVLERLVEAMTSYMPKKDPEASDPNVPAPADQPAQAAEEIPFGV